MACSWLNGSLRIHIPIWRMLLFTYYYICPYRYTSYYYFFMFSWLSRQQRSFTVHWYPWALAPRNTVANTHTHIPTVSDDTSVICLRVNHVCTIHYYHALSLRESWLLQAGWRAPQKNNTMHKNGGRPLCRTTCVCVYTNTYAYICIIYTFIYRRYTYYMHIIYMYNVAINSVPVFNIDARPSQG